MQVPISVVHKKGAVALDGSDALVMYVYGAYGAPADADFDATRLSLLNRQAHGIPDGLCCRMQYLVIHRLLCHAMQAQSVGTAVNL